jgi:hypothetical protein
MTCREAVKGFKMAKQNNSGKVLAEKPPRGVNTRDIQHSTEYKFDEKSGTFSKEARKGNANYQAPDRFVPGNPDYQSGVTQNVGNPVQSDGLRGAISLIRGK